MLSILIAFPRIEDATNIKNILIRNGYDVNSVCTTGAQLISYANELDGGIVICGYRLKDMHYSELHDCLPKGFEMLLIASAQKLEDCTNNDIVCLNMPIRMTDLNNTLQMMTYHLRKKKKEQKRPRVRTEAEKAIIQHAKIVLMERNHMTEEEAHRYIQKSSMDSGTNLLETAQMIVAML